MSLRPLVLLAAVALGGCSGENAGLITVTGTTGGVRQLVIQLNTHNGLHKSSITAPMAEGDPLTFPKTVSFTFPPSVGQYMDVCVEGRANMATVAKGNSFAQISEGHVTQVMVALAPDTTPCTAP